ncbi:hypothetical protein BOTBODRAFT_39565 [Botryobasidium botryosum FD-172 SS1]|uniref:RNA helicase n=1 Tax=Botryobasidium botryosum (strain FD-172 SS1) TaxID=930990 RepID=A0A067LT67_BOTB1|nr:hypothetical protein BOTBODRAFT_39565 [Botryobasidium botryosum FD-172 SS1]
MTAKYVPLSAITVAIAFCHLDINRPETMGAKVRPCSQTLAGVACAVNGCSKGHDLSFYCRPCNRVFATLDGLEYHATGKKHKAKTSHLPATDTTRTATSLTPIVLTDAGSNPHGTRPAISTPASAAVSVSSSAVLCDSCNSLHLGKKEYNRHANTLQHKARVEQEWEAAQAGQSPPPPPPANYRDCQICQIPILLDAWSKHLTAKSHRRQLHRATIQSRINATEQNQHGVEVSAAEGINFGVIDVSALAKNPRRSVTISAKLNELGNVVFRKAQLLTHMPSFIVNSRNSTVLDDTSVDSYPIVKITFDPQGKRGRFENRLELLFKNNITQQGFVITRALNATVGSEADLAILQPEPSAPTPTLARQFRIAYDTAGMLLGEEPEPLRAIPWVNRLKQYKLPGPISESLDEGKLSERIDRIQQALPNTLDMQTYVQFWRVLLHVEEHQMEEDLERFNMRGVPLLRRGGRLFFLKVPGLAEKRPSVMIGDLIKVITPGKVYGGFVHVVEGLEVGLHLHSSFPKNSGQLYDIDFSLCRIPLRRMHQALGQEVALTQLLFPTSSATDIQIAPTEQLKPLLYNSNIAINGPQLQAVASILAQPPGSAPFVIFGPPGTGKTVTIVEAILQILRRDAQARILVCAPSNSASDIIAQRLIEFGKLDKTMLFRLMAPSRLPKLVPDDLLDYTFINERGIFSVPAEPHVTRFQVIVSTCVSACIPFGIGVPRGNYSHIFIDEAGQAMEPEVMIPIKTIADIRTNLILSGDPKQLGPVIHSPVARVLGLEKSYLDRLMEMGMYEPHSGHGVTTVKLIKNYRSHRAILRFPNDQFYEGELQAWGNHDMINQLLDWGELGGRDFPIVFHGIRGKDEREGRSPSYFNIDEASLVSEYVDKLRIFGIKDSDIGVIAPYSAQCRKLRMLLKAKHPNSDITVGSAEQFQGQERTAIIISTVRSSQDEIEFDLRHTLGFVANKRRFNVAVTRAKALLIVIGDPVVLSLDSLWRQFMEYVRDNGGWKGAEMEVEADEDGFDDDDGDDNPDEGYYARTRRHKAESRLERLIERWSAMGNSALEEGVEEDDREEGDEFELISTDVPWRETEE